MKKFYFALLAVAVALAITPVALAGSLCPDVAWTGTSGAGTIVTGSGPCASVTMTIPDDLNDAAGLFWGSSSNGNTGLTVGYIASFNTSAVFTGVPGAQPYYMLDFIDLSGVFGYPGDKFLMIENDTNNLIGGNMALNPATTLFNVLDDDTGIYPFGQSDVMTLDQWLVLYPGLSNIPTWVGVEIGAGGTGFPASLTVTGADYTVTPEPTSLLLLGTGLVGLAGALRRKLRA